MELSSQLRPFLTTLFDVVEGPISVKDEQHRWVEVNDAFCELLGVSRADLLGKKESDFSPPEFTAMSEERERAVLQFGGVHRSEGKVLDSKGEARSFVFKQFRVISEDGQKFVGTVLEDQTRMRDAERRLNESDQRHKVIFDRAPVGVAYIGRNGRFRDINARFAQVLGYTADELKGQSYAVILHADDDWPGRERLKNLLGGEVDQVHFERPAKKKDGSWTEVSVWIAAIKSEVGKTDSAVVVLEDISERKRAELRVQAQNRILEGIARNIPPKDIFGSILSMVTSDWKGIGCAVLSANQDEQHLRLELGEALPVHVERLLSEGLSPEELFSADNEYTAVPVRSGEGSLLGAVVICCSARESEEKLNQSLLLLGRNLVEIAMERRHTDQRILDQQVQLFSASRMVTLGEMAAGIAHEINNPLAVIHGRAGHLKDLVEHDKYEAEVFMKGLVKMEETAMRIAKIIRGLRSFAREGSGDPFQPAKVSDIVADAFEFCRARFSNHEVNLEVEGDINPDLFIECRFVQIGQVMLNLLGNSFDAVQELPERWVKVQIRDLDDAVELSVTDSGSGIPAEIREKIMEPFFTTKEVGKGTGLGLSIVKGIVESHHGRVRVDAQCPNTRLIVLLPKFQESAKVSGLSKTQKAAA